MLKETKELIDKVRGKFVNIEEDIWIRATYITMYKKDSISHTDGSISPYREEIEISDNGYGFYGITGREKIKEG